MSTLGITYKRLTHLPPKKEVGRKRKGTHEEKGKITKREKVKERENDKGSNFTCVIS